MDIFLRMKEVLGALAYADLPELRAELAILQCAGWAWYRKVAEGTWRSRSIKS